MNSSQYTQLTRRFRAWTQEETAAHIKSQLENSSVIAVTGEEVSLPIGDHEISLCCHSDSPGAVNIVTAARKMVDEFNEKHHGSA
jgi:UPF0271 protein